MITRADALKLDAADILKHKRAEFSIPDSMIYLDGNSLGVLPKAAMARVKHAVDVEWGVDLITSWNKHGWFQKPLVIGNKIARLIGAPKDSVIVILNFANKEHKDYVIGMPEEGLWKVRFNSDWKGYDESFTDSPALETETFESNQHDHEYSAAIHLGPYNALILSRD